MTKVLNHVKGKLFGAAVGALMVFAVATIAATWFFTAAEEGGIRSTWRSFEQGPAIKAITLNEMRASLGFGGMIHEFKNYVLRMDADRLARIEARIAEAAEIDAAVKIDDTLAVEAMAVPDAVNQASPHAIISAVQGSVDAVVFHARAGMAVLGGPLFVFDRLSSQRDKLFHERAQFFGLRQRGHNSSRHARFLLVIFIHSHRTD